MLKKTIIYTDYNDVERKEDFYFNLSKLEVAEMEIGVVGGMSQLLTKIVNEKDNIQLYNSFKSIILKAYGVKSPDGKQFIKKPELTEAFTQSEAFNNLMLELFSDANAAADFVNGLLPKDMTQSGN